MTELQKIADRTADHARRQWAAKRFIVEEIAAELDGVDALLAELDSEWQSIENMAARIRHQCRRLEHLHNSEILELTDRQKLFRSAEG